MKGKKVVALLLTLCLVMTLLPISAKAATVDEGACGDNITWTLDSNGLLDVTGTGEMWMLSLNDVTNGGFWGDNTAKIKKVVFHEGITNIADHAFYDCSNLVSITIPESVKTIGTNSFYGSRVSELDLPDNLTTIYGTAFRGLPLKSIVIPDSVTTLGPSVFYECDQLESVVLPSGITQIRDLFDKCTALESVTLPEGLTEIGMYSFSESGLKRIEIPASVSSIGENAFANCSDLTEVVFTGTAPSFNGKAFAGTTTTCYYPEGAATWTAAVRQNYGGTVTWVGVETEDADDHSGVCGDNLSWYLSEDGTLTISGTGGMYDYVDEDAPWDAYCDDIVKIVINSDVTSIGDWAIYDCPNLTSVSIPTSVKEIGDGAFYGCAGLTDFVIPNGVTSIGEEAFKNCSALKSITLSNKLTEIGASAFEYAHALEAVTITGSVKTIGDEAFGDCTALKTITFLGNAPTIGADAFYNVTATAYYPADNPSWTESDIQNYGGTLSWVAQGADIKGTCGDDVTWRLTAKGRLYISGTGEMYDYVEEDAPWSEYRDTIEYILIEGDVTSIGDWAFYDCTNLTEAHCTSEITRIGDGAFYRCTSLPWFNVDFSVTTIGEEAFKNCSALKEISFTAKLIEIGASAFEYAHALESVTIPKGVKTIGNEAFGGCSGLNTVTFLGNAPTIGASAFSDVVATAYYPADNSTWNAAVKQNYGGTLTWVAEGDENALGGTCGANLTWSLSDEGLLLISGSGKMNSYADEDAPWTEYSDDIVKIVMKSGVTSISEWAFYDCTNVTSVSIPNTVESIGEGAFYRCTSMTGVEIPASVTVIGDEAFKNCSALKSIALSEGLWIIGTSAFEYDHALESVTIPESVESIANEAFGDCSALKTIIFMGDAPDIEADAFYDVTANVSYPANNTTWTAEVQQNYGGTLTWLAAGDAAVTGGTCGDNLTWNLSEAGVLTISGTGEMDSYTDEDAPWTEYCEDIVKVVIQSGVTSIGDWAIYDCPNLTGITIASSVKKIGDGAFYRCTGLTGAVIPSGVTTIGEEAFKNCSVLKSVSLPNTLTAIGASAFEYDHALAEVTIPKSVTTIGNEAFGGCAALKNITFKGDAPTIGADAFYDVTATAYYPRNNSTWSAVKRQNYGGTLTWVATAMTSGDMDGDEVIDNKDVAQLLWYTLFPDLYPIQSDADFDHNGTIDNEDVAYLLWHTLFPDTYPLT